MIVALVNVFVHIFHGMYRRINFDVDVVIEYFAQIFVVRNDASIFNIRASLLNSFAVLASPG